MEALAAQLAKALQITIEEAVKLLPIVKQEFIKVKMIEVVQNPLQAVFILGMLLLFVAFAIWGYEFLDTYGDGCETELLGKIKPSCKSLSIFTVSAWIIVAILGLIKIIVAPNYMFIQSMLQ